MQDEFSMPKELPEAPFEYDYPDEILMAAPEFDAGTHQREKSKESAYDKMQRMVYLVAAAISTVSLSVAAITGEQKAVDEEEEIVSEFEREFPEFMNTDMNLFEDEYGIMNGEYLLYQTTGGNTDSLWPSVNSLQ